MLSFEHEIERMIQHLRGTDPLALREGERQQLLKLKDALNKLIDAAYSHD